MNIVTIVAIFLCSTVVNAAYEFNVKDFSIINHEKQCWDVKVERIKENKLVPSLTTLVLEVTQKADLHSCCNSGYRPQIHLKDSKKKRLLEYPLTIAEEVGVSTDSELSLAKVIESEAKGKPYVLDIKCR